MESLYIHVPFCHRKCAYCSFYSVADSGRVEAYLDALGREMAARCRPGTPPPVRTLYVGGGTPSLLTVGQHSRLKQMLACHYNMENMKESTVEANPEDLSPDYLSGLAALGLYNRISIGVQSFSDDELRAINRRHTGSQARRAVCMAAEAGFDNISIDLIYGLPGQTLAGWRQTLDEAFSLPVKHISAYALTVEPGTILDRQLQQGRAVLPGEEATLAMYDEMLRRVRARGNWVQYEVSSFSDVRFQAVHNRNYWRGLAYTGFGAAAHSYDLSARRWNVADVDRYIATLDHDSETLTDADRYNEMLMLGLRTCAGVSVGRARREFPQYFAQFERGMKEMEARRWVRRMPVGGGHYCPTYTGMLHADGMAAELFIA